MKQVIALVALAVSSFSYAHAGTAPAPGNPESAWSCITTMGFTCFDGTQNGQPVVSHSVVVVSDNTGKTQQEALMHLNMAFDDMRRYVDSDGRSEFCVIRKCSHDSNLRKQTIDRTGDSTWACQEFSPANDCKQNY